MGCPEVPVQYQHCDLSRHKLKKEGGMSLWREQMPQSSCSRLLILRAIMWERRRIWTGSYRRSKRRRWTSTPALPSCTAMPAWHMGHFQPISRAVQYAVVFARTQSPGESMIIRRRDRGQATHNPGPLKSKIGQGDHLSCIEQMKYKLYLEETSFKEAGSL